MGYAVNGVTANSYKSRMGQGSSVIHISTEHLSRLCLALPPTSEQQRIVEILSTVDEAIEQTEALIAKTQQIKAGLMHDLFTQGVTPDGKLRPPREAAPQLYMESPLGWIPREWDIVRCGEVFDVQLGKMMSPAASTGSNQRPYLRNQNVYWDRLDLSDVATMHFSDDDMLKYRLRRGDLLACEGRFIGRCAIWRDELDECFYQKALHRLRTIDDRVTSDYMLFFLSLRFELDRGFVEQMTHESTIPHLPREKLVVLPVLMPPRKEQELIVDMLQALTTRDRINREYLRKNTRLKMGLMHDLLSGRVPVPCATTESKQIVANV
jgi:type I restriction enzyme S subunit